ncbi:putative aldouronate transport system substrate-binding protein [Paenibacillus sp. V4I9]|uniref:extracellular solute-binding protein n=1 Tax=Paenibacillus sp. V4I9 TaxID=3042308 RepID=UPI00278498D5|nr:extracellular solute-binding protein [Paenibacillus sp. V4I9]MDQ0885117.1 putative aldouronate transport system substrate-binding protein [Paenibacillus sp. V4I9]
MNKQKVALGMSTVLLASVMLSACGGDKETGASATEGAKKVDSKPFPISIVINQVGEAPANDNDMEKAMEQYTNTDLKFQWIPLSAYDEKVNVMIASSELPELIKLNYNAVAIGALKDNLFWEIGPYLKDYKNLSAQNPIFYENIGVDGKIYGVPLFRGLSRSVVHYRKDWFDAAGLKAPKSLDEWYNVIKAMTLSDPDKNGKNDTYGMMVEKKYNQNADSMLTRFSVMSGGPNKWQYESGTFTPEFMTEPFFEAMKFLKRLYDEKLINQDFAVVDVAEIDKAYDTGRAAIRISGGNAQSWQDKIAKVVPTAVIDNAPLEGPKGIRVPGESGNNGFLAIPKSSVKTEADMKKVLSFMDKLMDPPMATLLVKGIEGRHWKDGGDVTLPLDRDADVKEVKPYRDTLPQRNEDYNIAKRMKQPDLFRKNQQIGSESDKHVVTNPTLTLSSATFLEKGKELEQIMTDAETKFIMGKIDEAGWKSEIEKWKKAGGEKLITEYKEAYEKIKKK